MPFVRLREYGESVQWLWGQDLLDALRIESENWKRNLGLAFQPISIDYRGNSRYVIRAQGVTGFLRVRDLTLEIEPKFIEPKDGSSWRQALWQILAAIEERPLLGNLTSAQLGSEETFADLLGWILLDSLRRARLEGFPQGYIEIDGPLSVLRGRLNLARLTNLITEPYLIPCIYDVYSEDTALNRLLKWATRTLEGSARSSTLSRLLADEGAAFQNVSAIPPGLIEAEYLNLPIQYAHLAPALLVSRLLLRRQTLQHDVGALYAPSFLWKSSDVFERFVWYLLSRVCSRRRGWSLEKSNQVLANPLDHSGHARNRIATIPDFRILIDGRTALVLDAKYKTWVRHPSVEDVYPSAWNFRHSGKPTMLLAISLDLAAMSEPLGEVQLIQRLDRDLAHALDR
jgi:5-methylcytosine-specific restriction enzyme subunit McrC